MTGDRDRTAGRVRQALAAGDTAAARRALEAHLATIPAGEPAPPPVRAELQPLPPPTAKALAKAERARARDQAKAEAAAVKAEAGRKAQHTIALVIDNLAIRRRDEPDARWPDHPFAAPAGVRDPKAAIGAAGSVLRKRFTEDPELTPYEAALVILTMVKDQRAPVRLFPLKLAERVGQLRGGRWFRRELFDRQAPEAGWVSVEVGLSRFDPTNPTPELRTADDDPDDLLDVDTLGDLADEDDDR